MTADSSSPGIPPQALSDAGAPSGGPRLSRLRAFFRAPGESLRYRLAVASRAVAAILGGYVLTALVAAAMAAFLPMSRAEATLTGTLLSFLIYACAVIWVFAVRSAWRAWGGLLLPSVVLGLALFIHLRGGAA